MEVEYCKNFTNNADIYGRVCIKMVRRKDYEGTKGMEEKRFSEKDISGNRDAGDGIAVLFWVE